MAKQIINVGANANDGSGDDLRLAMQKINTNFTELFGATAEANDLVEDITPQLGGNLDIQNFVITSNLTNGNISLQPNGTGSVLLKNIRITDNNVISADDSTLITIDDSLRVTGSANILGNLTVPTLTTNTIATEDSSIIQINNGLQVTGTVKSTAVVTNSLSSEDSSTIHVGDSLNVSGDITVNNEVNADSFNTTGLSFSQNNITAYNSNDSIKLTPSGTGHIDVSGAKVKNAAAPTDGSDLATKAYVDAAAGGGVAGVTFSGDDSTGFTFGAGDELNIRGSTGISTAISGDSPRVLTIAGPDLSTYVTASGTATLTNKTIDANGAGNSISNIEVADFASGVIDTDLAAVSASDDTVPSAKAVKAYIDAQNTAQSYTLTFVGDDSTGTAVNTGETFKIAGVTGITTAVSGDVLTITGPDLSSYLTNSTITVVGDDSTGVILNSGETIKIQGASNIETQVIGDTLTITGPSLNNLLTVVGDDSTGTSFNKGETLKIAGGAGISTAVSGDTITISATGGGGGSIGDLVIEGQTITTGPTNADLTISPNGVGNINLDADRIRVGDLNSNVTISSNGSADLILTTDVDNPSVAGMASITIGDGVDGVTTIRPSDEGYVSIGNTTWDTLAASGARNKHGLAVTMDIDRDLSAFDLERHHANSIGARFNIFGTDQENQDVSPYRAYQIELISNLLSKHLTTIGTITFDSASKNSGIGSGGESRSYASGPISLGIQNVFRNNVTGNATVEETSCISSFGGTQHNSTQNTITINNFHGIQQSFDLAAQGGTCVTDNIRSFVATGNYFTNGNATVNNYYAFWAGQLSEATNNYGVYIESADWENYLGGLTIVDSTIRADRSNENITLETAGGGKVIVNDTLNVGTVELNEISSADSSAIQINDAVNVSGTLTANTSLVTPSVVTNAINSSDSSSVTINDDLNISGSLIVSNIVNNTMSTNEISSADSSAIQINDSVNISGTLNAKTIVTNDLISEDSTAIRVLDGLIISGALEVTQISSSVNVSGTLSVDTIDTNSISSGDSSTIQINDSVQISDNLTMGGLFTLANRTVAQLSILTPAAGAMAYCTDETGGGQPVFYDGTNWRRMTDRIVIS